MRRIAIGFLSAVLLAGVGLSAVASAHEGGEHLHFVARATSIEKADMGDGGKQVIVNFDVYEHDHGDSDEYRAQEHEVGERAGHGIATCITANSDQGAVCSGTVELDDGQLTAQGMVHRHSHRASGSDDGRRSIALPVTGGSGEYFGAAGEVEISHAGGDEDGDGDGYETMASQPADHERSRSDHESHGLHLAFHLE